MIYIGKFLYTTNQQEPEEAKRRHGEFNLIIAAPSKQGALEKFRQRIESARGQSEFFQGETAIYLLHLLETDRISEESARLFNFQSTAGDPIMPTISCQAPTGEFDGCRILDWQENRPGVDGQSAPPFIKFGHCVFPAEKSRLPRTAPPPRAAGATCARPADRDADC
jgi:hypothetical protein